MHVQTVAVVLGLMVASIISTSETCRTFVLMRLNIDDIEFLPQPEHPQ